MFHLQCLFYPSPSINCYDSQYQPILAHTSMQVLGTRDNLKCPKIQLQGFGVFLISTPMAIADEGVHFRVLAN